MTTDRSGLDGHGPSGNGLPAHLVLPAGWQLVDHFENAFVVILVFQRDGQAGPRITAIGATLDAAISYGLDRIVLNDERDRQRGVL